jgi:epoxyqueuosine reductase
LNESIRKWGQELGFQQIGIAPIELDQAESRLRDWLGRNFHGEMGYMARHGDKRSRPAQLLPGTLRVISARMDYLPKTHQAILEHARQPQAAAVSRYALGRDYHKLLKKRLEALARKIRAAAPNSQLRVFVDSAPVLEKPLAELAGLGWTGKHTNLVNRHGGSWFFLGEIYTDLPLATDLAASNHCGRCQACLQACPTGAIVAPYQLDARRCIAYLTIELHGSIPLPLRPLIGNRIFGCDDCQLVCPWNRFAKYTEEADFLPRHDLDQATLLQLFGWSEAHFLRLTEGSAIRRLGHLRWLRNIAVGLGNGPAEPAVRQALTRALSHPSEMVREHCHWALSQLEES